MRRLLAIGILILWVGGGIVPVRAGQKPEEDPAWWLEQTRFAYQQGDFLGALYLVRELRRRFPRYQPAAVLEAHILYDLGKYQECARLLGPLSLSYELAPEDLLLLARTYLHLQKAGEALFYARLVEKKARRADLICAARMVAARAYLRNRIQTKAAEKAREVLKSGCAKPFIAQALEVLLQAGMPIQEVQQDLARQPELQSYAPGIFKFLGDYFLRKGQLKKAEEAYFRYLNLSGRENEAPELLLKLGEAYFRRGRIRRARIFYKLLATAWPHTDQARFAKFRLYHLSYILDKRLGLPTVEQRKALIPLINELRRRHPQNPITQEAQALEIQLYLEDHKPERAFETAVDFMRRYPRSPFLPRVHGLFCEAANLYLASLFTRKAYFRIIELNRTYAPFAEKSRCGVYFYWLGKVYQQYFLFTRRNYYFLKAFAWGVPEPYQPELYLTLVSAALEEKKLKEAAELLKAFVKKFPFYASNPRYLYLEALYDYKAGKIKEAHHLLEGLFQRKGLSPDLRQKILKTYWRLALRIKDIDLALRIVKDPDFRATDSDFAFLIQIALENEDYLRAGQILKEARKRYPQSVTLKWLAGVYLEKMGRSEALSVWKELAGGNSTEARLAQGILRSLQLVDEAREVIY